MHFTPFLQFRFGRLISCLIDTTTNENYCLIQKLEQSFDIDGTPLVSEIECPLYEETGRYDITPSTNISGSISVIHSCTDSCTYSTQRSMVVEREEVVVDTCTFKHDTKNNKMYVINLFCMNYYSAIE